MAQSLNPATQETVYSIEDHQGPMVDMIIEKVALAQKIWGASSLEERTSLIAKVGTIMLEQKEHLARICTEEMGKPLSESLAEVEKCASACHYFAQHAPEFLAQQNIPTEAQSSYLVYQPLGVVLAVMPWNFPYWQVIRFAAPALCAGNGAVLKHASNVPGCAMALEKIFQEAGLPENLFRTLIIPSQDVARVIKNAQIAAVTLTGSTKAGRAVAATAGQELKKVVLELGGSDPYLILKDADLKLAAATLVRGRMLNAGQSCISPKRILVDESVYSEFTKLIESEIQLYVDKLGPLARMDLRDELHEQVVQSIKQGARLLTGGVIPKVKGAFYPPTLLTDLKPGMVAFDEELFGPVVCLIPFKNEEEALYLANLSPYGLGGGIFSRNIKHAEKLALKLETGGVFINDFLKSDPRLPFGGIKQSGHGRELSFLGIREFTNAKTIYVK